MQQGHMFGGGALFGAGQRQQKGFMGMGSSVPIVGGFQIPGQQPPQQNPQQQGKASCPV